jgi:GNAT superfamily N-acetyltransferase
MLKSTPKLNTDFVPLSHQRPGTIAALLRASYARLLELDPRWGAEARKWNEYDREAFENPGTVGACILFTLFDRRIAGFGSWDPRQRPEYGIVGHNCILPEFQGNGLGKRQIQEILRRFRMFGIKAAKASTGDHSFFIPAQRMYVACGFREVRRFTRGSDPGQKLIEYEKNLGR